MWVQGLADNDPDDPDLWKTFGENTARVWEGFRKEIGRSVPVVDTGAATINDLRSGKEYATQIVDGGRAVNVEYPISVNDDSGSCRVTASNPCLNDPGAYVYFDIFDHFGWDPNTPEEWYRQAGVDEPGGKVFHWWKSFPNNLHAAYDGMILSGRMLANTHLREFADETTYDLAPYRDGDVAELFPYEACPDGTLPSADNICWIDKRRGVPTGAPTGAPSGAPVRPKKTKKSKRSKKSKKRKNQRTRRVVM